MISLESFKFLPLNTKKQYVRGIAKSGCQIFIPVDSVKMDVLKDRQNQLNTFLASQPDIYIPPLLA